jgi:hypothetical protein
MFCKSCGAEISDQADVCLKCGVKVNKENAAAVSNSQQPPKTWLVQSILVTIFCCLPFGIAGIINALKVESAFNAGNIEEANRRSAQAGKWTKLAFWLGLAVIIIDIVICAIVFAVYGASFFGGVL